MLQVVKKKIVFEFEFSLVFVSLLSDKTEMLQGSNEVKKRNHFHQNLLLPTVVSRTDFFQRLVKMRNMNLQIPLI